jgi:hypothetical protein
MYPVISTLRRPRQEDQNLEANLDYIARSYLNKEYKIKIVIKKN